VDRALLVDTLPTAQQAAGNACAALMLGFGSVVGFFMCVPSFFPPPSLHLIFFLSGNLPLQTLLPFLQAESELQALSVLVSVLLLACHGLTAALVKEKVLLKMKGCVPFAFFLFFILFYFGGFTFPLLRASFCFPSTRSVRVSLLLIPQGYADKAGIPLTILIPTPDSDSRSYSYSRV
jgi:hypothetical protein